MGKNLCQLYIWQEINNWNIQGAQKTKLMKNKWPKEEMGKWNEHRFLKGRGPNCHKTHEKMFNITGFKGNANQNHVNVPYHFS
jgi:hypothetical protein